MKSKIKTTTTKKKLQAYFESKAPNAIVGISGVNDDCPLARYFKAINDLKKNKSDINIGNMINIDIYNGEDSTETFASEPKAWMRNFIEAVDSEENPVSPSGRVSAKKALEILAKC